VCQVGNFGKTAASAIQEIIFLLTLVSPVP
jgi:hypothetical protein